MRNQRPMPRTTLLAVVLTLATLPSLAAQHTQNEADPWPAFQKLSAAKQQAAAAEFVAALAAATANEHLRAVAALAHATDTPPPPRKKARSAQRAKRTVEYPHEPDLLGRRLDYAFGLGIFEPRTTPTNAAAKNAKTTDPIVLRHALVGIAPDADKALAALLHRLDADTRGDDFAAFLHTWRNGDESFYEALDRTAGTKDSVFFYDAMLGDFRTQFAKGHSELNSLQKAHDALHDAFLAYRQYRGFREAIAWSLLLPPDTPLPARLQRYEAKAEGTYSLRQQIVMAKAAHTGDLAAFVETIASQAPPLPQPLWATAYDPYPPWTAYFASLQPKMIESAGSTDAFLQQAEGERRDEAANLQRLASERIATALGGKAH